MNRGQIFRVAVRAFGPFESAIRKQWHAFEQVENTGLELDAVAFDLHDLSTNLFTKEGLKNGDWDVAFLNTDWMTTCSDGRLVADLAPRLRSQPPEGYPAAWPDSLLRLQQQRGEVLGLPYHDGPECLIYRKDLLENPAEQAAYETRYGAPLRVPETWQEFRNVARHFTRSGQGLYGSVFAAYPDLHNTVYDFCLHLWTRGGELLDTDGSVRLDSPAAVEGLEYYRSMVNDPTAVHPNCRKLDSVQSGLAFVAGEVALMVNWFGFAALGETAPDSRVTGRVGVGAVPHAERCPSSSLNIYWILSIAAGSPHQEVAWRFLRHCAAPEMDKLLTLEGAIGCRRSTWMDRDVNRIIPFYRDLDALHLAARELPQIPDWPRVASAIEQMMMEAIDTGRPAASIARFAQQGLLARHP